MGPVLADTHHTNTEFNLVAAFQQMAELAIWDVEHLPCELLTNVMQFCYSKSHRIKGIKPA